MRKFLDVSQYTIGFLCFVCAVGAADKCYYGGTIRDYIITSTIAFGILFIDYLVYKVRHQH